MCTRTFIWGLLTQMTHHKTDSPQHNMRYRRLSSKILHKGVSCFLLFLVLVAALVIVQLFLYYDSTTFTLGHAHDKTKWPLRELSKNNEKANDERTIASGSRSRTLPDLSLYPDPKYDHLKMYHNKGLSLRLQFDCSKLFESDQTEQNKILAFHAKNSNTYDVVSQDSARELTTDCEAFRTIRGYRTDPGSSIEEEFPLAYVILVHKDFEHVERLLRTIYRPQHSICIHVDNKAPESLKQAVSSLTACFNNVVVASQPQEIVYAHVSRLMADVVCMGDLLKMDNNWRYLINYAATEFPLKTNLEIVKVLQLLDGRNDIHEQFERRKEERFTKEYVVVDGKMKQTNVPLPPPPFNLTIIKGQAYNTFSREFIKWALTDEKPKKFLEWSNKTFSPDEHYWATLNDLFHNAFLKTPGGFKGHPDKKGYITRFISWQYSNPRFKCQGRSIHNICNFSALDLPILLNEMHLAANKFDLTLDPVAYACMEELIENRTIAHLPFNIQDYSRLYFINYKSPAR